MKEERFFKTWEKFDRKFWTESLRLCKKNGFVTHLKDWNYCPYCVGELYE